MNQKQDHLDDDEDWDNHKPVSWGRRTIYVLLVVMALAFCAYILKWPVKISYSLINGYLELQSMEPREIILGEPLEERIRTRVDLPDSSYARLAIPRKYMMLLYNIHSPYQSSFWVKTSAETVGQNVVDKLYAMNKAKYPDRDYEPPPFTLQNNDFRKKSASRIQRWERNAISVATDNEFKAILTARMRFEKNPPEASSQPENFVYVPREVEAEGNLYIQCPYQDDGRFCTIEDEIDQKITITSMINRSQLQNWKLLRDATRKFVMQYYLNP